MSPLKANSLIQLALQALGMAFPRR